MVFKIGNKSAMWELIILFSWLPAFAYTIGIMPIVSFGIYTSIVLITIKFVVEVLSYAKVSQDRIIMLLLFMSYAVYSIIKLQFISEGTIRSLLYLGLMMMSFYMCFSESSNSEDSHSIYYYPLALSFFMFILSFNHSLYEAYAEGRYSLYLGYQNPNILSYVLLIMLVYITMGYIDEKKSIFIFGDVICLYLILLTHCRSSLLAAAFFVCLVLIKRKSRKINAILSTLFALIPAFFVFAVILFRGISINFLGKEGVSGRDLIWKAIFEAGIYNKAFLFIGRNATLSQFPLLDSTTNSFARDVLDNSHNAYMQMFSNYGLIVTVVFMCCIVLIMIKTGKMVCDKYSYSAYIGAVAILINCSFETHIVDAIIGMTFMWILLYKQVIDRGRRKNDNYSKVFIGKAIDFR